MKFETILRYNKLKKFVYLFEYEFKYYLTIRLKVFKKIRKFFRFENVVFIFFVKREF